MLWEQLKWCFQDCFFKIKQSHTSSMSVGLEGLPGNWMVWFCRISLWEGIWELIGIDCRSRSMSLRRVLMSLLVLRAVLIILTCHSVKLLDWGKWGKEVKCLNWCNYGCLYKFFSGVCTMI